MYSGTVVINNLSITPANLLPKDGTTGMAIDDALGFKCISNPQ